MASARKLHQKAHTCIERLEIRFRAWQIHNKPLFYSFAIFSWLFTTLAAGAVLDVVLPRLETGWFVRAIALLIGALIFLAIFILAFGQRKKRGFLFWYPWSMVFVLTAGTLFLETRQSHTEKQFSQMLADTNSYFLTSNSFSLWMIQENKKQIVNLQSQFNDYKRDSAAEKSDLKIDVIEANRARDAAKQELTFFEANPEQLTQIYSNIFARVPTSFQQFDLAYGQFTNVLSGMTFEKPNLSIRINGIALTNVDNRPSAVVMPTAIQLSTNKEIKIWVKNSSEITATHVIVDFEAAIDPTNLIADSWILEPPSEGINHWRIVSPDSTPQYMIFQSVLKIAPGFNPKLLTAVIYISADNSISSEFAVIFAF